MDTSRLSNYAADGRTESELRGKQDTATGLKDGQKESNPLAELRRECRDVGEALTRSSKGG